MIYDDDQSIGVDVESFQKLEAIVESILNGHNNLADELNNTIPPAVNPEL